MVPAVCAWPKDLAVSAANCKEARLPEHWAHTSKRQLVRLVPPVDELYACYVHANCTCNEMVAIANRVLGRVPLPTREGLALLQRACTRLKARLPKVTPMTMEAVLATYSGRKRRVMEKAAANLRCCPINKRNFRVKLHIKAEKNDPSAKENPDPRAIQARDSETVLELAMRLKPIEHVIYRLKGPRGTRMVAKGLNAVERALLIEEKWMGIPGCAALALDLSRMDQHCAAEVLRKEHSVYNSMLNDPVLQQMLAWQLDNIGRSTTGVRYYRWGGRMSGDFNTGLGNCTIMIMMMNAAMAEVGVVWDCLLDGDDCILFVGKRDIPRVRMLLPQLFLSFGQELKVEDVFYELEHIKFCQCKFLRTKRGPLMVKNWVKVLSTETCGVRHWSDPKLVRSMLHAVGQCELAACSGVPIIQAWSLALIRNGDGKFPKDFWEEFPVAYMGKMEMRNWPLGPQPTEVTLEARLSFELAFGVCIARQYEIESILETWTVETTVAERFPLELDSTWKFQQALGTTP